jgi:hypothetical protein
MVFRLMEVRSIGMAPMNNAEIAAVVRLLKK